MGFPACALDYPRREPSLPGKQGQRGKPQDCRIITSACLSFPLESQFQPLRRRRRGGGQRRQWGWRGRGVIRHYCLSLPTPAGQNDLASPSVALKEGGGGSETGGMGGAGGRWRQIPKRDESGMKETGVTKIKPQSRTACEQRRCHLERHRQNVRGGGETYRRDTTSKTWREKKSG